MVAPKYLLDTNMWIYALKGKNPELTERLGHTDPASIAFCSIVQAELWQGAHRYGDVARRTALLRSLFERHTSFGFDSDAAETYGQIRHQLESKGQVIGPMDLLIAAIAVVNDLTLVTHNTQEFARVNGLMLEDWVSSAE